MKLDFFKRPVSDQALFIREPAARRGLMPVMVEKDWKNRFFAATWAHYDLAKPGTFRIVPPDFRLPELDRDYRAMRPMFLTEPPSFAIIIEALRGLEYRINQKA